MDGRPHPRQQAAASAYPPSFRDRVLKYVVLVVGGLLLLIVLRNAAQKDYAVEAQEYMKSAGMVAEGPSGESAIRTLPQILLSRIETLEKEVDFLRNSLGNLTGQPFPKGPPNLMTAQIPLQKLDL